MEPSQYSSESADAPRWRALNRYDRRVLGVLMEKAKTTPDSYPLSLNALRNGCNQKSNRHPKMELEEHDVEDALERLRQCGAIASIQGDGRVEKYRHLAYQWLDVEKVELAVMAELLLRGAQTVGELRGRAARMEPISGLSELQPILDSLIAKGLVQRLTPPGRGCVVSHQLYLSEEQAKVLAEYGTAGAKASTVKEAPPTSTPAIGTSSDAHRHEDTPPASAAVATTSVDIQQQLEDLKRYVDDVAGRLRRDVEDIRQQLGM